MEADSGGQTADGQGLPVGRSRGAPSAATDIRAAQFHNGPERRRTCTLVGVTQALRLDPPGYGGPLAFTGRASGLRHHNSAHERRPTIAHRRLTSTNTVITGWPEPTSAAEDGSCPRSRYRMRPNRSAQRPPRPSSPRYCSNIAAAGTVVTVHCVLPAHLPTRRHPIPRSTPTADAEPAKTGTEIEVEQHPSDFRPEGVPSVSISGHPMAAAPDRYHHLVMAPSMCPSCGVMERT